MIDIYRNSIWLKYREITELEHIHQFIKEWSKTLDKRKNEDLKQIENYKNEDYGDSYVFIAYEYNHLYAHFLLTIYSALEYDLKCLSQLDDYKYENFCKFLDDKKIKINSLKNVNQVNLLRLYCNAYKHNNGLYTDELIEIQTGYKLNDEIQYFDFNILEQYYLAYEFLCNLYQELGK